MALEQERRLDEQKAQIEDLQARLEALETGLEQREDRSGALYLRLLRRRRLGLDTDGHRRNLPANHGVHADDLHDCRGSR